MRVYKELCIDELRDEIYSEKLDTLADVLEDDNALEHAVAWYVHDLDDAENDIEEHYADIVKEYLEYKDESLKAEDMEKLGLTLEQCRKAGIFVAFQTDEKGRKFYMVDENPLQMNFLDGGRVRKYLEG